MIRMFVESLVAVAGFVAPAGAAEWAGPYAIVVKKDVAAGLWGKDVRILEARIGRKVRLLPAGGPFQIVKKPVRGLSDLQ